MKTPHSLSAVRFAPLSIPAVLVAIVLVLAACGGSSQTIDADQGGGSGDSGETTTTSTTTATAEPAADAATPELAAALATWNDLGLQNYSYTFTRACECPDEDRGPFRVIVVDGEVDRVEWFGNEVDQPARTVPELYDAINDTAGQGLEVSATFDELTGHPVEVLLDLDALAVDGGEAITVTSFFSTDILIADLESARAQWSEAEIVDYELTYRIQCFCPEIIRRVTVRDGVAVEVVDEGDAFDDWPGYTVEDLFAELETAIDAPAATINVSYDEGFGFPSDYYIDLDLMMADEEQGVTVIDFTPLP